MSLPKMRPFGDPQDGPLMQCLHCGQVMGQALLLQVAHHNHCDGDMAGNYRNDALWHRAALINAALDTSPRRQS